MNILILNWRDPKNPKAGGAEIVTLQHAKAWVKAGHRVTWFASKFKGSRNWETLENVKIVRGGNSITVYLLAPIYYFFSGNIFDLVIDEIHGIPFFTPLYVKKPKIAFIHEVAGKIWDYMYPFPISLIGKKMENIFFKPYKGVQFLTVSESTKKELEEKGIEEKNVKVILNGIDFENVKATKEKNPTLIFVSRIVKMKGIEDVIRSFFYITRDLKDSKLWIVGNGESGYIDELKDTIESFGLSPKVRFWGKVSDEKKFELMKKAHLLLHASVKEGWGLVVVEAASQATPAIVYDVSGLRDSVKNGKTGIILKENSAKEMAKEAVKLLKNDNKFSSFQERAVEWARTLTWEKATNLSNRLINKYG